MFTGLIEAIGEVVKLEPTGVGYRLGIRTDLATELAPGDSLAVNGVCLTVVSIAGLEIAADVGPETARVTTLESLRIGNRINLERPMRADGRLGGHFVQGHIDGTAVVEAIRPDGDSHWATFAFDPSLSPYLIRRGSTAVNGVSLTVADLGDASFSVMIIPFTWQHTTFSSLQVDDRVNLECDMIGKYVARSLELTEEERLRPASRT